MTRVMRAAVGVALWFSSSVNVFAATVTATATVNATVPAMSNFSLTTDAGSAATDPLVINFDTLDSTDMTGGSPNFEYAPKRSITGKNWHVANIASNTPFTLTAQVTGTIGGQPAANVLSVFCGGLFINGTNSGWASTNWEPLQGFSRTRTSGASGSASFNYRLDVTGVQPGTSSASVVYTLTTQ